MQDYYGGMNPDEMEGIECCRYGTPESVAEELVRFAQAGATTLILRFAGDDQEAQLDLCTRYLLPRLRSEHID